MKKALLIGSTIIVLIASVSFLSGGPSIAEAASQGALYPSSGTNNASVGTVAWVNPGNITLDDGSAATIGGAAAAVTRYITGSSYGFSVPTGATIDGVVVEAKKLAPNTALGGSISDNSVRLLVGGTPSGTNKAIGGVWPNPSATYVTYGGAADAWGLSLTPADVNASNFGAVVSGTIGSAAPGNEGYIDTIRITVYYTGGAGPASITSDAVFFE